MPDLYHLESFEQYEQLHYYTLRGEQSDGSKEPRSLAEDFFRRMRSRPEATADLRRFLAIFVYLGNNCHSVLARNLLRHEATASALPPYGVTRWLGLAEPTSEAEAPEPASSTDVMLRLYCYPAADQVLILLNGDQKTTTARTAQECPRVSSHFNFAQRACKALDAARRDREWTTHGPLLLPPDLPLCL